MVHTKERGRPGGTGTTSECRLDLSNSKSNRTWRHNQAGLALAQFDWGHPNNSQLHWLRDQGVKLHALLCPWPVGAIRARLDGPYFVPDDDGSKAITFVCFDRGIPIDVCAWFPTTGETATYLGRAFCLGDHDDCYNPATWFAESGLLVHASPLEWLRANREGIVIIRPKLSYANLRHVPRIVCADVEHAEKVEMWSAAPKQVTRYLVPSAEAA